MMKQLLSLFAIVLITLNAQAQTIPNGNFESWDGSSADILSDWEAPTITDFDVDTATAFKSTDAQDGNFSLKLETMASGTDTGFGYVLHGDFGEGGPSSARDGFPISGKVTALNGYYKCDVQAGDSAGIAAFVLSDTITVAMGQLKVGGQVNSWTAFSVPLFYTDTTNTPETVVIAVASSDVLGGDVKIPGSKIWIDNFTVSGTSDTVPNHSFERWSARAWEDPTGWGSHNDGTAAMSSNFTVKKSTDVHSGMFSVSVEMDEYDDDTLGYLYLGGMYYDNNRGHTGTGIPFTSQVDTICGYYKYSTTNVGDKGIFFAQVDSASTKSYDFYVDLDTTSTWKYFEKEVTADFIPTHLYVTVSPSQQNKPGSILLLDNVQLKSDTTAVGVQKLFSQPQVVVYPNPASDQITVITTIKDARYVEMIDMAGRLNKTYVTRSSILKINTSDYPTGYYVYRVLDNNKRVLQQGKISIAR